MMNGRTCPYTNNEGLRKEERRRDACIFIF
jgi:hypothetical protein